MIIEQKEPDEFLKAFWELNRKHPEYVTCVRFDGASLPYHDMDELKKAFKKSFSEAIDSAMDEIAEHLEVCEERGIDPKNGLEKRKALRELKEKDFSHCKNIEELHSIIPETLKPHWRK